MSRRWSVILGTFALVSGSLFAVAGATAATAATAGPAAHAVSDSHHDTTSVRPGGARSGFVPGGVMHRSGGASARGRSVTNQAESTKRDG
jgi:hypothetical protein